MRYFIKINSIFFILIAYISITYSATHPMDGLSAKEIVQTVKFLNDQKIANKNTQYPYIGLLEMPKKTLKKWQYGDPIIRMAKVVMYKDNQTFEVKINLTNLTIISENLMTNVEPSVMAGEWHIARNLTLQSAEFINALKKRNITELKNIYCSPNPAGYFKKQNYDNKRIFKVPCYEKSHSKNHLYGRPIEGLFSIVDIEAKKVIDIVDTGVVKTPDAVFDYESGINNRPAL
ncbi:MAG: hypothetical protein HRU28_12065, partial [Rhizobiales bacterium]|nr:hypothetical protein [Hyphomicrobiales bacterium]